jgi:uncharacterized OB-fold protein
VGRRCRRCNSWFFPPTLSFCRNPACGGDDLDDLPMSRRGSLWSFTVNHYPPPPPYVVPEGAAFEPYGVAAVELATEQMIVLGQLARGVDARALRIGAEMEVVIEPLADGLAVWKWRPVR